MMAAGAAASQTCAAQPVRLPACLPAPIPGRGRSQQGEFQVPFTGGVVLLGHENHTLFLVRIVNRWPVNLPSASSFSKYAQQPELAGTQALDPSFPASSRCVLAGAWGLDLIPGTTIWDVGGPSSS